MLLLSQVEEIKAQNGERVQDGTAQPQRPLFEVRSHDRSIPEESEPVDWIWLI